MTQANQICTFCHKNISPAAKKCDNCGEFLSLKSKRLWFHILPAWLGVLIAVFGVIKVKDLLDQERIKAIENHLTWVEVQLNDLTTAGNKDPKDSTSTFWQLEGHVRNLGKQIAFVQIKDWSFDSTKRGHFTNSDFQEKELTFTLARGQKANWYVTFVLSTEHHFLPLLNGDDVLTIKFTFVSKDMSGKEECTYKATWKYTKGVFSLLEDDRRYRQIGQNL